MKITWNEEKNIKLQQLRDLSFEMVLAAIDNKKILADEKHKNNKYSHQRILVVDIDGYAVVVPYVIESNNIFFKTMFRDRKMQRRFYGK